MGNDNIGADLYRLYIMATENLPHVAEVYDTAANGVEYASSGQAQFSRHPQFGGSFGPTLTPWLELRDTVHDFLAGTADNLRATGDALLLATKVFAAADADSRDSFQQSLRNHVTP